MISSKDTNTLGDCSDGSKRSGDATNFVDTTSRNLKPARPIGTYCLIGTDLVLTLESFGESLSEKDRSYADNPLFTKGQNLL